MAVIIKPKVPFAVSKKPVQPGDVAKPMAAAALVISAAGQHVDNLKIKSMMTAGALDLYENIEKRDALDSMIAMLAVSLTRHATKGAATVADLVKVLDKRRGAKSEKVTVGQVNVEAGGQAIVGNVESAPHPGASPTKPSKTD